MIPPTDLPKERPLRIPVFVSLGTTLLITSCSAVGWELQNYAFYGGVPTADGRRLTPVRASEKTIRIQGLDSTLVAEAEFELDTVRIKGERYWVATTVVTDSSAHSVIDSVWLERYELRTVRTFHQDSAGNQIRQSFDRRVVKTESRDTAGRVRKRSLMHTAEPYSRTGIDLVLSALRWGPGTKGALPVVSRDGRDLAWLEYEVVGQTSEAKPAMGGLTFGNVWIVKTRLDGKETRIWVDDVDHSVIRRSEVRPDGSRVLVSIGAAIPRVSLFAVEPIGLDRAPVLGGATLGGRVLGGGKALGAPATGAAAAEQP